MSYSGQRDGIEIEFARLVNEFEHTLQIFAFRVTKCEQIAKDVVQDVFLKLWEHRNEFPEIDNISAWLYRVTENKLIDHLRKTASHKRLIQKTWNNIQNLSNETELKLAAKESAQFISDAISQLPEQRRIIYKLNRDEQLSYEQIAQNLHISRHTVKNQISSALHQLRDCLKSLRFF
jgi:RNA polymerase sigma-70 factor (family 1)